MVSTRNMRKIQYKRNQTDGFELRILASRVTRGRRAPISLDAAYCTRSKKYCEQTTRQYMPGTEKEMETHIKPENKSKKKVSTVEINLTDVPEKIRALTDHRSSR